MFRLVWLLSSSHGMVGVPHVWHAACHMAGMCHVCALWIATNTHVPRCVLIIDNCPKLKNVGCKPGVWRKSTFVLLLLMKRGHFLKGGSNEHLWVGLEKMEIKHLSWRLFTLCTIHQSNPGFLLLLTANKPICYSIDLTYLKRTLKISFGTTNACVRQFRRFIGTEKGWRK